MGCAQILSKAVLLSLGQILGRLLRKAALLSPARILEQSIRGL
jgi:hypothetical protein